MEAIATIGDNLPPPDVTLDPAQITKQLKDTHALLLKKAEDLIAADARILPKCESEEYSIKLTNFIKQANEVAKLLDKNRLAENKPYKAGGKAVDDLFNGVDRRLEAIRAKASKLLTGWLQDKAAKEQKARLEAAEQLRREAAAQEEAAKALLEAGRRHEGAEVMLAAEKIADNADHLQKTATLKTAVVAQVTGATATSSLRTKWVGEITDKRDLDLEVLKPFLSLDALQRALDLFVAAGNREIKGAKIHQTSTAVTR